MSQEFDWRELLATGLRCGLSVNEFWDLTPAETVMVFEAVGWRWEREIQRDLALAWHIAALGRRLHLPSLEMMLRPRQQGRQPPTELRRRAAEHAKLTERMLVGGHRGERDQARRRTGADPGDAGRTG